jgi:hypothetical protein
VAGRVCFEFGSRAGEPEQQVGARDNDLKAAGYKPEFHIYSSGGHGWGMRSKARQVIAGSTNSITGWKHKDSRVRQSNVAAQWTSFKNFSIAGKGEKEDCEKNTVSYGFAFVRTLWSTDGTGNAHLPERQGGDR